jgi:hypothetical protein
MYEPPRYEFWRPITPVEGERIPPGAQYQERDGSWDGSCNSMFHWMHLNWSWRVPVEVIPLDVAVNVVLQNAVVNPNIGEGLWQVFIGGEVIESNRFEAGLRLIVTEALRKAAQ